MKHFSILSTQKIKKSDSELLIREFSNDAVYRELLHRMWATEHVTLGGALVLMWKQEIPGNKSHKYTGSSWKKL